jgi:hypothetical protein
MMDLDEAKRVLGAFQAEGVEYVLVGSVAMAAQGLIRATRDIDLFVRPTAENVESHAAARALLDGHSLEAWRGLPV